MEKKLVPLLSSMTREVLLATNNQGKVERYKMLAKAVGLDVVFKTPKELEIGDVAVEENEPTLRGNAEKKARAYAELTDLSVLANDTGIWVDGEGFVDAPKRITLQGKKESEITREERNRFMLNFWKDIATKNGGAVDAEWRESFVLINPDGEMKEVESVRPITLTNQEGPEVHYDLPIRSLYISKATGTRPTEHTKEDELIELKPNSDVLKQLLQLLS